MNRLYDAVAWLNAGGVGCLVVMGDLVNGTGALNAKRLLREVAALCGVFRGPVRYMPGNHDLDHLSKMEFYNALGHAGDPSRFQFEFGGHTFVCLDGNFSPDGTAYNRGNFEWQQSFVPEEQIDWLRARLVASFLPVMVLSHQRVDDTGAHFVANAAAVREVIASSDKVKAVFQGHNHQDDIRQIDGTTYYSLAAHVDGAGPAAVQLDAREIRLVRDFRPGDGVAA